MATGSTTKPVGVHLVGSLCGADTAASAYKLALESFPDRLRRLPDGEPAHRSTFIGWQMDVFPPNVLKKYDSGFNHIPQDPVTPSEAQEIVSKMPPLKPGYDDFALESYAEFKRLKKEGVIPKEMKFQVCFPSVFVVTCLVREGFQEAMEPVYEKALLDCLRRIEEVIPKEELAIQWDIAGEPTLLEGEYWPHFKPWFAQGESHEVLVNALTSRIARLIDSVSPSVEVGMHICYGDMGHKHFVQPKDTGLMVDFAKRVIAQAKRKIDWVHMPVPRSRDDEAYFLPLKDIQLSDTELYLGLVHAKDEEGTKRRVDIAQKVLGGQIFGVSTECGMGRTPVDDLASISAACSKISLPIK